MTTIPSKRKVIFRVAKMFGSGQAGAVCFHQLPMGPTWAGFSTVSGVPATLT
jgi:hypothetical protein